ncbi:MAG: phosphomannomutase/phosphoglucomutase [Actinobacteria bacterium]|nr:phosphomannomutase/phosphoglucomutase [Actinomycetota bacterium]
MAAPSPPPPQIFKAYDVRGLSGEELDGDTAFLIGRGFARVLAELREKPAGDLVVGLGHDMRESSPEMAERACEGMVAEGVRVLDAGRVATEQLYFLVGSRELDGGAMVTASHNPRAYTGMKLLRERALALSGDAGIQEVRAQIEAGLPDPPGGGSAEPVEVGEAFHRYVMGFVDPKAIGPLRVLAYGSDGMAGPMVGPVLEQLGVELRTAAWEPSSDFPERGPNPMLEENRELIAERIREDRVDLAIAWDGDADRCFFFDEEANFCDGDFVCALLAEALLRKEPGAMVLCDPRSSRAVPDRVAELGGRTGLSRVGHAFFKRRMRDEGAVFGGEVSGHYYFRDFYCADSGAIPALLMLELVSSRGSSLGELMAGFRSRYFISGEINSEVPDQDAKMAEIERRWSDGDVSHLDGISIDYPDWHFNVRPSNTEPLLRLNLESLVSREHMADKRDEVLGLIRS